MPTFLMHTATVTVSLPLDIDAQAELAALRAAGIPVDALGNAESGYLFVRLRNNGCNIFRWFASSLTQKTGPP